MKGPQTWWVLPNAWYTPGFQMGAVTSYASLPFFALVEKREPLSLPCQLKFFPAEAGLT